MSNQQLIVRTASYLSSMGYKRPQAAKALGISVGHLSRVLMQNGTCYSMLRRKYLGNEEALYKMEIME